jgi:hypothetical protein
LCLFFAIFTVLRKPALVFYLNSAFFMTETSAASCFTNILAAGVQESWSIEQALSKVNPNNPRTITEKNLKHLRDGLRQHGFLIPILYNQTTDQLVSGQSRLAAAQFEEITEIPVVILQLSEEDEIQLSLALNKIEGEWDYALLEEALERLAETDKLVMSGFTEADMVDIFAQQDVEYDEDFTDFAERMISSSTTLPVVKFRSLKVQFVCSRTRYDKLINTIHSHVGINDVLASAWFFKTIGLTKVELEPETDEETTEELALV